MAEREVLKEFLAKIGFHVDQPSLRNWLSMIKKACITAGQLGATILGVVVALETLVLAFARGMERLYYASIRTKSSVGNIQALEFALGQVGLEGEQARAILEHLGERLRVNPATEGLMKMLGVETQGRERIEVVIDLIKKLKSQFTGNQYAIGANFAAKLLGVDERTYFQLTQRIGEIEEAIKRRNKLLKESGLDPEDAAKRSREYMNELREIWEKIGLIGGKFASDIMPVLREMNSFASKVLDVVNALSKVGLLKGFFEGLVKMPISQRSGTQQAAIAAAMALMGRTPGPTATGKVGGGARDVLDNARNNIFPFESKEEALDRARRSLEVLKSEGGGSPDASLGREIARTEALISRLGGGATVPTGTGNAATRGAGTRETSDAISLNVNSSVVVHGASDPAGSAAAVERVQTRVMGDAVRNLSGVVR